VTYLCVISVNLRIYKRNSCDRDGWLESVRYIRNFSLRKGDKARRVAIREADAARDSGDAVRAANLYGAVLEQWGANFGLLVQRGNALKDSKAFVQAEALYQAALNIRPLDADCHLQLGHLMKLSNEPSRAEHFYREAHRLDPSSDAVLVEIAAIEARRSVQQPTGAVEAAASSESAETLSPSVGPAYPHFQAVDRGSRSMRVLHRLSNEFQNRRN
jgi:tetratricopeptide (TPR) repeat protein